ncbi:hypothetical protein K7432_018075 [Basidiobolus ranarum]|uniref:Uncharacterized protein n=1 Tax=Basidiobolus ranarum TaxID=34480 RepID=A0ABR2VJI4_9FUNG
MQQRSRQPVKRDEASTMVEEARTAKCEPQGIQLAPTHIGMQPWQWPVERDEASTLVEEARTTVRVSPESATDTLILFF